MKVYGLALVLSLVAALIYWRARHVAAEERPAAVVAVNANNVALRPAYEQVCVIQGLDLTGVSAEQFERDMEARLGVRIQFLEVVKTLPDRDSEGRPVADTGGRSDVFFAAHRDDVHKWYTAERLAWRIRWLEDVLDNDASRGQVLYPERIRAYADK